MSEEDELSGKDPFGEEEEVADENLITKPMVNKATYHMHKLAEQRKQDYKEIQQKCKKLFAYTNLAKVTLENGHSIIDKLVELTGGEEEVSQHKDEQEVLEESQLPTTPDDGIPKREIKKEPAKKEKKVIQDESEKIEELEAEIGKLAEMLHICVGYSRDIVQEEIGKNNITEGTQAMLVKSFTATLFIEASKRGLGR